MPSYTLEIEAFGVYTTNMPSLEIWEDGVLDSTHLISSSGSTISVTINYGGSLPTSLALTFNDAFPANGRTIEIRSVKINDKYVNVGNYLSADSLVKSASATVDIASSPYFYDSSDPALSEFTTGATRTMTAGNDTLRTYLSATPEIFDALAGRDVFYLGSGDDKVFGNTGDDIIYAGAGNDLISGGDDNDRIYGGDGNDKLYGGNGDDRIHGEDGDDEIHGGAGNDRLNGHAGNDVITGGAGADKLNGGDGVDYLFGDDDNDSLVGGAGNDTLDGGAGDDLIYGGGDDDIINGGDDNDILIGDDGDDIIHGDDGNDILHGLDDDDTLYGGTGNDLLFGGNGSDILNGDDDIDVLVGGDGADTLNGGDGNDTLHGSGLTIQEISTILKANPNVVFNSTTNSFYEYVATQDTWANSNTNAIGSTLSGVAGHLAVITSQVENDYIFSLLGNNVWLGGSDAGTEGVWQWDAAGAEEDGIQFWQGDNTGGAVNNAYTNFDAKEPDAKKAADDYLLMDKKDGEWKNEDGSKTNSSVIEWEAGLISDDNVADTLNGGAGNDHLYGYGGDDVLNGGDDNDIIFGGSGDDTMNGDAGDDILIGDFGNDILNGGAGDDILYSGSTLGTSGTSDTLISATADEGEEVISSGNMELLSSSDTEMGYESSGVQLVGLRWQNLSINQGAVISRAYIEFRADESDSAAITLTFHGEDIDSAAAFTTTNSDVSSRTQTTASVDWHNVESWTAGSFYQTPDISVIIQEIVDRGGWTSGTSDLVVFAERTVGTGTAARVAESFDGGSTAPRLVIEYVTNKTIIVGGTGNDELYGSSGMDIFEFSDVGAANVDTIYNFDLGVDQIDLSDLLTAYDPTTDLITDYIQITDSGGNSDVRVDTTGSGSFGAGTVVAVIDGITGLTDEAALLKSGDIII